MAAMCDVPDIVRQKIMVRSRHRSFLESLFGRKNWPSKRLDDAFYATLLCQINQLPRSDPGIDCDFGISNSRRRASAISIESKLGSIWINFLFLPSMGAGFRKRPDRSKARLFASNWA
jgi:hypothetical protein